MTERLHVRTHVVLRPDRRAARLGEWQVFVFVNTTGDTHPLHIHQSQFQPLGAAGATLDHCHVLEHEDTDMMRPFVVTVTGMHRPMHM